ARIPAANHEACNVFRIGEHTFGNSACASLREAAVPSDRVHQLDRITGDRDLEIRRELSWHDAACGRDLRRRGHLDLECIDHGMADLRFVPVTAVELAREINVGGEIGTWKRAQTPWLTRGTTRQQRGRSVVEFTQPHDRDDEPAEHPSGGVAEV